MKIKVIKQERLYVKAAQQLAEHIDKGRIRVGERLPSERALAEQFGVSRPTIREAMIALELAGRVEIRSGSGVYVSEVDARRIGKIEGNVPGPFELLEARFHFEGDAAALAAKRASDKEISAIKKALADMKAENRKQKQHEKADERFHILIAKASGNSAMHAAIRQLWDLRTTSALSVLFHEQLRKQGIKPVIHDHQAIVDAIEQRDGDTARQAMRSHLQRVIDAVIDEDDAAA